jgi:hypothetical protein
MRGVLMTIKLPHVELAEDRDEARKCFLSSPPLRVPQSLCLVYPFRRLLGIRSHKI